MIRKVTEISVMENKQFKPLPIVESKEIMEDAVLKELTPEEAIEEFKITKGSMTANYGDLGITPDILDREGRRNEMISAFDAEADFIEGPEGTVKGSTKDFDNFMDEFKIEDSGYNTYNQSYLGPNIQSDIYNLSDASDDILQEFNIVKAGDYLLSWQYHLGGDIRGNYSWKRFKWFDRKEQAINWLFEKLAFSSSIYLDFEDGSSVTYDAEQDSDVYFFQLYEVEPEEKEIEPHTGNLFKGKDYTPSKTTLARKFADYIEQEYGKDWGKDGFLEYIVKEVKGE